MTALCVRDRRRGFAWLGNEEVRLLRETFEGRERGAALALYVTLCEAANSSRAADFQVSRARLAKAAGTSPKTVDRLTQRFVDAGLLEMHAAAHDSGAQAPNVYTLLSAGGRHADYTPQRNGGDTPTIGGGDTPTPPLQEGTEVQEEEVKKTARARGILSSAEEPFEFSQWLGYHCSRAERTVPRAGTSARSELARVFAALVAEGYGLEDFKLASDGVLGDAFMVENGHTKPENVLRKSKLAGRIDDGRKARAAAGATDERAAKWDAFEQANAAAQGRAA